MQARADIIRVVTARSRAAVPIAMSSSIPGARFYFTWRRPYYWGAALGCRLAKSG